MFNQPKGRRLSKSFSNLSKPQNNSLNVSNVSLKSKDEKVHSHSNSKLESNRRRVSKSMNSLAEMMKPVKPILSFADLLPEQSVDLLVENDYKIVFKEKGSSTREDYTHAQDYQDKKQQLDQEIMNIQHFIYKDYDESVYYKDSYAIFSSKFNNSNKRRLYLSTQLEKPYYIDFISTLSQCKKKIHDIKFVFLTELISINQSQSYLHFLFESYPTTLQDLLSFDNNILPENQIKFYAIEILEALAYLHSQDVFYIDLHPSYIYITDQGHIKLSNSILRNELKRRKEESKVGPNLYGHAGYIAPEVLILLKIGPPADLWSLGILLYRLSFGCLPLPEDNSDPIYFQMYKSNKISYNIKKETVPLGIRNLITKLLLPDPNHRLGGLQGVEKVKSESWFKEVRYWKHVEDLLMVPPCIPESHIDRSEYFADKSQLVYDLIDTKSDRRAGLMLQEEKKDEFQEKRIFGELMWDVTRSTV